MYRSVSVVVLGVALMTLSGSTPAHALAFGQEVVHIPFAFHVLHKTLPAGDYIIEQPSAVDLDVLLLWSKDGRSATMVPVEDASPSAREMRKSQLVFDTYGNERFLRSLVLADEGEVTIPATREELKVARQTADATVRRTRQTASTAR
jgi:hypothetical protein